MKKEEVSKRYQVDVNTLTHYEEIGLLDTVHQQDGVITIKMRIYIE